MSFCSCVTRLVLAVLSWLKYRIFSAIKQYKSFTTAEFVPDRKSPLKILQYNVSWPTSGKPYVRERVQEFSERIAEYDILILTGAFQGTNGLTKLFIEISESRGLKYYVSGPAPAVCSLQFQDSGTFIFSRFPITWSDVAAFPTSRIASLGAVYARVRISAFENAHFFAVDLSRDAAARQTELGLLVDLIKRHVTDLFPVFVGGNFGVNALVGKDYAQLTKDLEIIKREVVDLAFDAVGEHPETYGIDGEVVLTPRADRGTKQSVDFLFQLKPRQEWVIDSISTTVEKLPAVGKYYRQLSPHYGIAATVALKTG
jgi:endonuclease/exonuclease/phosphatase family metal-dependent hydrolase